MAPGPGRRRLRGGGGPADPADAAGSQLAASPWLPEKSEKLRQRQGFLLQQPTWNEVPPELVSRKKQQSTKQGGEGASCFNKQPGRRFPPKWEPHPIEFELGICP